MVIKKRMLLWDWTNTRDEPNLINKLNFNGAICSVSNWNTWVPPELKNRLPYYPMVHDMSKLAGSDWANIENSNAPIVLFLNEPERAGVSPQQAADAWNKQMVPLRHTKGKKLASPSCASDPAGQAWINTWMGLVHQNPPDFLGLHWYGTDANAMETYLKDMHNKHNKPIMVTEWASISRDYKSVVEMTVQCANFMDNTTWVFQYALFGCMRQVADGYVSPAAQLMDSKGNFTDLMYKYMYDQPMHT